MDTVVSGRGGKGVLLVFTERMTREEEIYKINSKSMHDVTNCINQIEQAIGLKNSDNGIRQLLAIMALSFLMQTVLFHLFMKMQKEQNFIIATLIEVAKEVATKTPTSL